MLRRLVGAALAVVALSSCRTPAPPAPVQALAASVEDESDLTLGPPDDCRSFRPAAGPLVMSRDARGRPLRGIIRVLAGNPSDSVWVVGAWNDWGARRTEADHLHPMASGTPYFEGPFDHLKEGEAYRIEINGAALLDPAAPAFTGPGTARLSSAFWDTAVPLAAPPVDLRGQPVIIAAGEVHALAQRWRFAGREGPAREEETYDFVASSGLVAELHRAGYNAVELLPVNASVDGAPWRLRYRVFGPYAPDPRYGTPAAFARMVAAFNRQGIAVIAGVAADRYAVDGGSGDRSLAAIGAQRIRRADGTALFGGAPGSEGTNLYDQENPDVRRFVADGMVSFVCRYGISGVHLQGQGTAEGGDHSQFLGALATRVRQARPGALVIGDGGGVGFADGSAVAGFVRDNLERQAKDVDLPRLAAVLASARGGAGAAAGRSAWSMPFPGGDTYIATLLGKGDPWYYVEKKTMAFEALALLSGAPYRDLPQLRLLQEGSFETAPEVDWRLLSRDSPKAVYGFLSVLSTLVRDRPAPELHSRIDGDGGRRVVAFARKGPSGRTSIAVVNLSHIGLSQYRLGVDERADYKVLLSSDDPSYGGAGELARRLPGSVLVADGPPAGGAATSMALPYLAPYGTVVLERQ